MVRRLRLVLLLVRVLWIKWRVRRFQCWLDHAIAEGERLQVLRQRLQEQVDTLLEARE
jgi:hypothetical protein